MELTGSVEDQLLDGQVDGVVHFIGSQRFETGAVGGDVSSGDVSSGDVITVREEDGEEDAAEAGVRRRRRRRRRRRFLEDFKRPATAAH